MIAKKNIPAPVVQPPVTVSVTMTEEEATLLARLTLLNVSIPDTAASYDTRLRSSTVCKLLNDLNMALADEGIFA